MERPLAAGYDQLGDGDMKRWKKVIIWAGSIIIVLGVGGLFAANYAADRLIASLAASLEAEILLDEAHDTGIKNPTASGATLFVPISSMSTSPASASSAPASSASTSSASNQPVGENTIEDSGKINNNALGTDYNAEISVEKAKEVQENVTLGEKAKLTSIFLKQLSMEDIKELQKLASGGLTIEDKKKARSLILEKLSPEQYDELIEIAKKYGMSQGRAYEEVIKEK